MDKLEQGESVVGYLVGEDVVSVVDGYDGDLVEGERVGDGHWGHEFTVLIPQHQRPYALLHEPNTDTHETI